MFQCNGFVWSFRGAAWLQGLRASGPQGPRVSRNRKPQVHQGLRGLSVLMVLMYFVCSWYG